MMSFEIQIDAEACVLLLYFVFFFIYVDVPNAFLVKFHNIQLLKNQML